MKLWEIVVWIIIAIVIVWQLYAEFAFQDCYDGLETCGDSDEKWHWEPQEGDNVNDLVRRIEIGTEATQLIIKRGLVVVGSAVIAIIVSLFLQVTKKQPTKMPELRDFFIIWGINLGLFWAVFRYYESHYTHPISHRTLKSVQELKYQLNIEQRPQNINA